MIYNKKTVDELYGDIMDLPHFEPKHHPRMALYKRAAQFAPFAALTGYDAKVEEAARYVDRRVELTEEDTARINNTLQALKREKEPEIRVRYFQKDEYKDGGSYLEMVGKVKKIDEYRRCLTMKDGTKIMFADISSISSEIQSGIQSEKA